MFKLVTEDDKRFMEAAKVVRSRFKRGKIKENEFDMHTYGHNFCSVNTGECGTTHCIGGWISLELGGNGKENPIYDGFDLSDGLQNAATALFMPSKEGAYSSKRSSAIEALDNFIARKSDPWKRVKVVTKKRS